MKPPPPPTTNAQAAPIDIESEIAAATEMEGKDIIIGDDDLSFSHLSDHDNVAAAAAVNYAVAAVTRAGKKEVSSLRSFFQQSSRAEHY